MSLYGIPDKVKLRMVVETTCKRGQYENEHNPPRTVYQYWSLDGKLLAEYDTAVELVRMEPVELRRWTRDKNE